MDRSSGRRRLLHLKYRLVPRFEIFSALKVDVRGIPRFLALGKPPAIQDDICVE